MSCIVFANKPILSIQGTVEVPVSKSVANRFLVLDFLCGYERFKKEESSWSKDIKAMWKALASIKNKEPLIDIEESGTALRFLGSVLSIQEGQTFTLTGKGRIPERTMQPLVEALRKLGADINYLEKEGFAPLLIQGKKLNPVPIKIDGKASSQFASALLLIAPFLEGGLTLQLSKDSKSLSYLALTLETLGLYGAKYTLNDDEIIIPQQTLIPPSLKWPSDWSSVPYFLALAACVKDASILVKEVQKDLTQADYIAIELFKTHFGVDCTFDESGLHIMHKADQVSNTKICLDGTNYPDLVPSIICCAAVLRREIECSGIEHLRFKESDRIATLEAALKKLGYKLQESRPNVWQGIYEGTSKWPLEVTLDTQSDHRIAMSLSLFAAAGIEVKMNAADCIDKSFPNYWQMLSILGISYEIT